MKWSGRNGRNRKVIVNILALFRVSLGISVLHFAYKHIPKMLLRIMIIDSIHITDRFETSGVIRRNLYARPFGIIGISESGRSTSSSIFSRTDQYPPQGDSFVVIAEYVWGEMWAGSKITFSR